MSCTPNQLRFYKAINDLLHQYYYQYGHIIVSILEEQDEGSEQQDSPMFAQINRMNDKEMRDAQVAFENLEASRSIIRNRITSLNIEFQKLQEQLNQTQIEIADWENQLYQTLKRIGDLQFWREDWEDSLFNYEKSLEILQKQNEDRKGIAELYYKIGNIYLQQNNMGCEELALKNLKLSFQICYEESHGKKIDPNELNSKKSVQKWKTQLETKDKNTNLLLEMLLEKIEDTLDQMKECNDCQQEIERWQNKEKMFEEKSVSQAQLSHQFEFNEKPEKVLVLGKLDRNVKSLGKVQIKRLI